MGHECARRGRRLRYQSAPPGYSFDATGASQAGEDPRKRVDAFFLAPIQNDGIVGLNPACSSRQPTYHHCAYGEIELRIAAAVVICLLTFGGFLFLEQREAAFLGGEQVQREWPIWAMPAIFSLSTFLGVLARSIYEVLTRPKAPKTYREVFAGAVTPNRLLLALVISPIVIGAFYKTIRLTDDVLLILVSSFQNGFFWKSVMRK
jgi:hypothetical protein